MNMNFLSTEFKQILLVASEIAKNHKLPVTSAIHVFCAILQKKDSNGYSLLSVWAEESKVDLDKLRQVVEDIIDNSPNDNDEPVVTSSIGNEVEALLKQAEVEAKNFGLVVFSSDFFILAMFEMSPQIFSLIAPDVDFDPDKIKEIISGNLTGGGDINPKGVNHKLFDEDDGDESVLREFSIDLTQKARDGKIDPVIGRDIETQRMIQILHRKNKNNPILIGEPGVGKTAIVEGFCKRIVESKDPDFQNLKVYQLNLSNLVAGTKYRGEFEQRMEKIIHELVNNKNIIIFVDELHILMGAGAVEGGSMDGSNILKPYLARGDIRLIGATTTSEYRKYIERDAAFARRLQVINVDEPSETETMCILEGCKKSYEDFHHLIIEDETLELCTKLSNKFIPEKFMPDKALDILDEACAKVAIEYKSYGVSDQAELQNQINVITKEKEECIKQRKPIDAKKLFEKENSLLKQMQALKDEDAKRKLILPKVTKINIAEVVGQITGIDVKQLTENEVDRLFHMEDELKNRVKGQNEAISILCKAIRRWKSGVNDPKRPICCVMELGPTGVGKTELAKSLAEYMFGTEDRLIKVDMSEYSNSTDVSKILGSTYGFVGYGEESKLVKQIRSHPHSVVLFDEITRAHRDIYPLFLQLMDEGILTTGDGKTLNFRNAIVLFTSNLGAEQIFKVDKSFGFGMPKSDSEKEADNEKTIKAVVNKEVEREFPPEFINRLDKTVVFHRLNKDLLYDIVRMKIDQLSKRIQRPLQISDEAVHHLVDDNFDERYGARPVVRAIEDNLEDKLAEMILKEKIDVNTNIEIGYKESDYSFTAMK